MRVRIGTVICAGSSIGAGLETGHGVAIREENVIADHVSIWSNSTIDYGCTVGNNVKFTATPTWRSSRHSNTMNYWRLA